MLSASRRREAEVRDAHPSAAVEHHVGRLEVAVQDAAVVSGGEARTNLARDVERLVGGQVADARQQRGEVLAVDVFHREEMPMPIGLADVEHAAHVRVCDLARDADFGQKMFPSDRIVGKRAGEEFQRDWDAELEVVRPVDLTHASTTEQSDDAVAPGDTVPGVNPRTNPFARIRVTGASPPRPRPDRDEPSPSGAAKSAERRATDTQKRCALGISHPQRSSACACDLPA
jgi:hypothetical protein